MTEPLIYTSRGNVPVSSLEHYIKWDVTAEFVKFTELYKCKRTGEVVREDCHVRALKVPEIGAAQAAMA